jgi:hypothetical protein
MDLEKALAIFTALSAATVGWVDDLEEVGRTGPKYTVRLDANYAGAERSEESRWFTLFVRRTVLCDDPVDAIRYVLELAAEHGVDVAIENDGLRLT